MAARTSGHKAIREFLSKAGTNNINQDSTVASHRGRSDGQCRAKLARVRVTSSLMCKGVYHGKDRIYTGHFRQKTRVLRIKRINI